MSPFTLDQEIANESEGKNPSCNSIAKVSTSTSSKLTKKRFCEPVFCCFLAALYRTFVANL